MEVIIISFEKAAFQIIIYILRTLNLRLTIDMDNMKSAVNLSSKRKTELNQFSKTQCN